MTQRIEWIDTAKMLTMFLVIIGHCNYYTIATPYGGIYYTEKINSEELSFAYRFLKYLVAFIYTFHMPLFMALSGMLFSLSMKRGISFSKLVRDKAMRLLIPFMAVSLFLSIPIKFAIGYWEGSDDLFKDIVCGQFLLMGNSHLWFVVALFWIFIVYFFIEKLCHKKDVLFWMVILLLSWIGWYIEPKNNFLGLPAAMKYTFFFAVGFNYLPNINKCASSRVIIPILSLIGLFSVSTLFQVLCKHNPDMLFLKFLSPITFSLFALTGIFSVCMISKAIRKSIFGAFFKNNTYELYLYSDPFNYLLIYIGWSFYQDNIITDDQCSIMMFFIRFCGSLTGGIFVIWAINALHIKSLFR